MRVSSPSLSVAASFGLWLAGCCVNPFVHTATDVEPGGPGSPERETGGSLEEHPPAVQAAGTEGGTVGDAFDMRLVRVQPGVHIGTEQHCDLAAVGRLETIDEGAEASARYSDGATQRMSVQCVAPSGESWADLTFTATNVAHAAQVEVGVRIRVRIHAADGGFFDYPIVDFVTADGRAAARAGAGGAPSPPGAVATGFDLRQVQREPALVGTSQPCAVSHVGDIDILEPRDLRRRSYPAGVQNRMTIRCRHTGGEEWADLVFMPAQARSALHVRRGDVIQAVIVSRSGGFFDYAVLQYADD